MKATALMNIRLPILKVFKKKITGYSFIILP